MGGADVASIERLKKYVKSIGLLYQAADEILDVTKVIRGARKDSREGFGK